MRVLFISDRRDGGILRHVRCLRACLPPEVETYEIGCGADEEFAGQSGHDIREWFQIRRIIRDFKPDIIHFHIPALMMMFYVRCFSKAKIVRSWHTSTTRAEGLKNRIARWLCGRKCYYLPVSSPTFDGLRRWAPGIKGEVFFNPIRIGSFGDMGIDHFCRVEHVDRVEGTREGRFKGAHAVVGMVGRNAKVKDWPSFHKVESEVKRKMPNVEFVNGGEKYPCNGREEIGRMDVFVMTSKHEELPTTMLECFLLGTPICGFLPVGGTCDVLGFSNGAVRDAFSEERDCRKLADTVVNLLNDEERRRRMVEDGWQILKNHFAAEMLVKDQLMEIYKRVCGQRD